MNISDRISYLNIASASDINAYFTVLSKLPSKYHKKIYREDMDYYINNQSNLTTSNQIGGVGTNATKKKSKKKEQPDIPKSLRELYESYRNYTIQQLKNKLKLSEFTAYLSWELIQSGPPKNIYCNLANHIECCENKIFKLEEIKKIVDNKRLNPNIKWEDAVHEFVILLGCCGYEYEQEEKELDRTQLLHKISRIIIDDYDMVLIFYNKLGELLRNETVLNNIKFIKELYDESYRKVVMLKLL